MAVSKKNHISGSAFVVFGKEMTVCGCEKVICYTDDKVVLGMRGGELIAEGKYLAVTTFFGNEIKICGDVRLLKFEESEGKLR